MLSAAHNSVVTTSLIRFRAPSVTPAPHPLRSFVHQVRAHPKPTAPATAAAAVGRTHPQSPVVVEVRAAAAASVACHRVRRPLRRRRGLGPTTATAATAGRHAGDHRVVCSSVCTAAVTRSVPVGWCVNTGDADSDIAAGPATTQQQQLQRYTCCPMRARTAGACWLRRPSCVIIAKVFMERAHSSLAATLAVAAGLSMRMSCGCTIVCMRRRRSWQSDSGCSSISSANNNKQPQPQQMAVLQHRQASAA